MKLRTMVISILAACATAPFAWAFSPGENLLTPVIELAPDEWEELSKTEGPMESLMWRKKSSSELDAYVVTIIHGEDMSIREFREIQDKPGREACDEFETIDLPSQKDDAFPSAFWRTECFRGGALRSQILQLAIVGNDSLYHVQRIWRGPVSTADRDTWIGHIASIYVCDTRSEKQRCPEGFEKVEIPTGPPAER